MRTPQIILLAIALTLAWARAAAVDVKYTDNQPEGLSRLHHWLNHLERKGQTRNALADSARSFLRERGYLDAVAELTDGEVTVTAGSRYRLASVSVPADSLLIPIRAIFTEDNVESAIQSALDRYRQQGHYFARARIAKIERNATNVQLVLNITAGPVVTVADNVLTGLQRSNARIVRRFIPAEPGDTLTDELIETAEEAAEAITFLQFVPPLIVRPQPGYTQADLEYQFREKPQVQFEGGGGYIPDDPTGLVWNINLDLLNLFGSGRRAGILSERREEKRSVLEIDYRQPLFLLGVGNLRLNARTRDYREDFYEFGMSGEYLLQLGSSFNTGLGMGWKRVEPTGDLRSYSLYSVSYVLDRTALDDRINPSEGLLMRWEIAFANRRYASDTTGSREVFNETRTDVTLGVFYPLVSELVGHVELGYSGLETSEDLPPLSELIFVGGPRTIRGFRNEQFVAQRLGRGTVEPRLRFNTGYAFVFYDGAYINTPQRNSNGDVSTKERYENGYGFGIAFATVDRSVKLSIGWNPLLPLDQPRLSIELISNL
jgi:outer membrane protein assembly factor BamA